MIDSQNTLGVENWAIGAVSIADVEGTAHGDCVSYEGHVHRAGGGCHLCWVVDKQCTLKA